MRHRGFVAMRVTAANRVHAAFPAGEAEVLDASGGAPGSAGMLVGATAVRSGETTETGEVA